MWKLNQAQEALACPLGLIRKTSLSIWSRGSWMQAGKKKQSWKPPPLHLVCTGYLFSPCHSLLSYCSLICMDGSAILQSIKFMTKPFIFAVKPSFLFPSSETCRNVFQGCKIHQHQVHGSDFIHTCALEPHGSCVPLCHRKHNHYIFIWGTITPHPCLAAKTTWRMGFWGQAFPYAISLICDWKTVVLSSEREISYQQKDASPQSLTPKSFPFYFLLVWPNVDFQDLLLRNYQNQSLCLPKSLCLCFNTILTGLPQPVSWVNSPALSSVWNTLIPSGSQPYFLGNLGSARVGKFEKVRKE